MVRRERRVCSGESANKRRAPTLTLRKGSELWAGGSAHDKKEQGRLGCSKRKLIVATVTTFVEGLHWLRTFHRKIEARDGCQGVRQGSLSPLDPGSSSPATGRRMDSRQLREDRWSLWAGSAATLVNLPLSFPSARPVILVQSPPNRPPHS